MRRGEGGACERGRTRTRRGGTVRLARSVGVPEAYDYGPERCSWMTHHMTNWMGDDGFLRESKSQIRRHNPEGDTLFINGCGRVDLPGSDSEQMYHSLQKLAALPDDTLLLPGHNYSGTPNATMAETKAQNPYLNMKDLMQWKQMMG